MYFFVCVLRINLLCSQTSVPTLPLSLVADVNGSLGDHVHWSCITIDFPPLSNSFFFFLMMSFFVSLILFLARLWTLPPNPSPPLSFITSHAVLFGFWAFRHKLGLEDQSLCYIVDHKERGDKCKAFCASLNDTFFFGKVPAGGMERSQCFFSRFLRSLQIFQYTRPPS